MTPTGPESTLQLQSVDFTLSSILPRVIRNGKKLQEDEGFCSKHAEPCPPLKTDYSDCQIDENNRKVLMKCWADGLRDRTQASDSQ